MRHLHRILLVEDDECTRLIMTRVIRQALAEFGSVECVCDGEEAIRLLAGEGEFADRSLHPFPSALITDLSMPRVDGFGVLEFLAANDGWSVFPKIVMSNSDDPDDVRTAISPVPPPTGRMRRASPG